MLFELISRLSRDGRRCLYEQFKRLGKRPKEVPDFRPGFDLLEYMQNGAITSAQIIELSLRCHSPVSASETLMYSATSSSDSLASSSESIHLSHSQKHSAIPRHPFVLTLQCMISLLDSIISLPSILRLGYIGGEYC